MKTNLNQEIKVYKIKVINDCDTLCKPQLLPIDKVIAVDDTVYWKQDWIILVTKPYPNLEYFVCKGEDIRSNPTILKKLTQLYEKQLKSRNRS